ncbi:hypothetical protein HDU98_010613 [Podochytrium sp. JEL0797]|nr:hypothetical protein HDU98_010613 [Podochytrium sp. JEL0797]
MKSLCAEILILVFELLQNHKDDEDVIDTNLWLMSLDRTARCIVANTPRLWIRCDSFDFSLLKLLAGPLSSDCFQNIEDLSLHKEDNGPSAGTEAAAATLLTKCRNLQRFAIHDSGDNCPLDVEFLVELLDSDHHPLSLPLLRELDLFVDSQFQGVKKLQGLLLAAAGVEAEMQIADYACPRCTADFAVQYHADCCTYEADELDESDEENETGSCQDDGKNEKVAAVVYHFRFFARHAWPRILVLFIFNQPRTVAISGVETTAICVPFAAK